MKYISIIIGVILTIGLIILLTLNTQLVTKIDLFDISTIDINNWLLILVSFIIGAVCASCYWKYYMQIIKEGKSKHERIAEKASIKAEEHSDKLKALEAKILTLEQALKKALKDTKK